MLEQWLIISYLYFIGFYLMSFYLMAFDHIKKPRHLLICFFGWYILAAMFGVAVIFITGKHVEEKIKDIILK